MTTPWRRLTTSDTKHIVTRFITRYKMMAAVDRAATFKKMDVLTVLLIITCFFLFIAKEQKKKYKWRRITVLENTKRQINISSFLATEEEEKHSTEERRQRQHCLKECDFFSLPQKNPSSFFVLIGLIDCLTD